MSKANRYSPEVREQAVQMVLEHEKDYESRWSALRSISSKIGCTPETLRSWLKRVEIDAGRRPDVTTSEQERIKVLEKENKELRKAGVSVPDLCREHRMSSTQFYKWRAKDASMVKHLKELGDENRRLKKMYAEKRLKAELRQEALEGTL